MRLMIPLVAMLLLPAASLAADAHPRTIRVSGEGKSAAPPDTATIMTGVVTHSATAKEALSSNSQAMRSILELLKEKGVASKDIQTSNLNIQPDYKRDQRGRTKPEIVGYRVTNQLRVRVRNLPKLGEIIFACISCRNI